MPNWFPGWQCHFSFLLATWRVSIAPHPQEHLELPFAVIVVFNLAILIIMRCYLIVVLICISLVTMLMTLSIFTSVAGQSQIFSDGVSPLILFFFFQLGCVFFFLSSFSTISPFWNIILCKLKIQNIYIVIGTVLRILIIISVTIKWQNNKVEIYKHFCLYILFPSHILSYSSSYFRWLFSVFISGTFCFLKILPNIFTS